MLIAAEAARLVPGRASIGADAPHADDAAKTVEEAHDLLHQLREPGAGRERLLIKAAATWAGIEAVRRLQPGGVDGHVTLVFSTAQALASAEAGAVLISPFMGRIGDWQRQRAGAGATSAVDQGVAFGAEAAPCPQGAGQPDSRDGGLVPQAPSRSSRSLAATGSPSRPTSWRSWRRAGGPSRRRSWRRDDPRDPGRGDRGDGDRGGARPRRDGASRSRPALRESGREGG